MMTTNITVRAVNPSLWRKLKAEAVKEGLTIGEAVNLALDKWLREYTNKARKKPYRSFWGLKPVTFAGKDTKELSRKVDEVLYG